MPSLYHLSSPLHKPSLEVALGEEWAHLNDLKWDFDDPSPKITEEVRKFLLAVREHTGLFVERAPKRYGFMHLTFEEYYVARYLIARSRRRALMIRQHLLDPRWEEPILLALGFVGLEYPAEASELFETAILAEGEEAEEYNFKSSPYENLLGRDYLFALRCLGDNIPVRPRLQIRLFERLANELMYHSDSAIFNRYRLELVEKIEYLKDSDGAFIVSSYFKEALQNASSEMRLTIVKNLENVAAKLKELAVLLIDVLQHEPEAEVRLRAAKSLGITRSKYLEKATIDEVVIALLDVLQHDTEAKVRIAAAKSLSSAVKLKEVVPVLLDVLQHDAEAEVRTAAAEGLWQATTSSKEVVPMLLDTFRNDPEVEVREAIFGGYCQMMTRLVDTSIITTEIVTDLLDVLQHEPEAQMRFEGVESLLQSIRFSTKGNDILKVVLQTVSEVRLLHHSVLCMDDPLLLDPELLTNLQSDTAFVATLRDALNDNKKWYLRRNAARLLGMFSQNDEDTIHTLWRGLLDTDNDVRKACASALVRLARRLTTSSKNIEAKLIQAIKDPEFDKLDFPFELRSGHDYAFDGLWLMITGSELE